MKKFLTTLAVLTAVATPAFAQSFDPDNGTGNVLPFSATSTATHHEKSAANHNAMRAFASAPGFGSVANQDAPQATGGGSVGYNEMLRNY
ncbi:MAG TPA: hypothetical protein VIV34_03150 [Pseudolabrys sp.]